MDTEKPQEQNKNVPQPGAPSTPTAPQEPSGVTPGGDGGLAPDVSHQPTPEEIEQERISAQEAQIDEGLRRLGSRIRRPKRDTDEARAVRAIAVCDPGDSRIQPGECWTVPILHNGRDVI